MINALISLDGQKSMFDLFASFLQDEMVNLLYKILETKKNNNSGLNGCKLNDTSLTFY